MNPESALQRSELSTIRAVVQSGVAIIRQSRTDNGSFHARLLRRDDGGQLRMSAMQVVGDFVSLADAISAIRDAVGHDLIDWQPDPGIDLRLNDDGGMQPTGN